MSKPYATLTSYERMQLKRVLYHPKVVWGKKPGRAGWRQAAASLLIILFSTGCPYDFPAVISDGGEEQRDGEPIDGELRDGLIDDGTNGKQVRCSNESLEDCNPSGSTLTPESAFVDQDPPEGFIQCAGFINTQKDNVRHDWENNCLGVERVLRIRYWDTSEDPWILLGDATLTPASTADYGHQIFDATDHGGTEGVLANAGVEFFKDAPGETSPSYTGCDNPGQVNDYAASDMMLTNRTNTKTLWVCSVDHSISAKPCPPDKEMILVEAPKGECVSNPGGFTHLAIAIYFLK